MGQTLKGRQAVYLVDVPPGWKPQNLWHVLPGFTSGELHAKNLSMQSALGFARIHNKAAVERLQAGQPATWAIVCRHLRPSWRDRSQRSADARGGAA